MMNDDFCNVVQEMVNYENDFQIKWRTIFEIAKESELLEKDTEKMLNYIKIVESEFCKMEESHSKLLIKDKLILHNILFLEKQKTKFLNEKVKEQELLKIQEAALFEKKCGAKWSRCELIEQITDDVNNLLGAQSQLLTLIKQKSILEKEISVIEQNQISIKQECNEMKDLRMKTRNLKEELRNLEEQRRQQVADQEVYSQMRQTNSSDCSKIQNQFEIFLD